MLAHLLILDWVKLNHLNALFVIPWELMQKPWIRTNNVSPKPAKLSQSYEWCTGDQEGGYECVCHSILSLPKRKFKISEQALWQIWYDIRMTFVCVSAAWIINTYIRFVDFGWLITLLLYHHFWYNCKKCILLYIKPFLR